MESPHKQYTSSTSVDPGIGLNNLCTLMGGGGGDRLLSGSIHW